MYNTIENIVYKNISATPAVFQLRGGNYGLTVTATWGGGSLTLQRLAADGTTYVTVSPAITVDGYVNINLPNGTYKLLLATATALYVDVVATVTTQ